MPKMEDRSYIHFEKMKRELRTWSEEGHRSVGFLGGEPTTYPKIVESVAYAKELGFTRIAIATNATKLRLTHFTDKILEAGLTRVTLSMHGHTPELEDRLTRVPGNFEKKCTAIRYLQKKQAEGYLRDGLSINIVLNGWNYRYLPKMMKFFYETMGLPDLRVNFIRPEGNAIGSEDLTPRYTDVMPYVAKALILNEHHFKKTLTFGGFPLCRLPAGLLNDQRMLQEYVGELRDLSTDASIRREALPITAVKRFPMAFSPKAIASNPNLRANFPTSSWLLAVEAEASLEKHVADTKKEGRMHFNWQDRKRIELKGQPSGCERCPVARACEGVWVGYLDIWGDSEFSPPPMSLDLRQ
jgi:MoaA/NifB/PqqE/SkfB family radical SAM enzyme